ncbi:MAG: Shedu immune nuclease family protein [Patescibacteria group bacterium]
MNQDKEYKLKRVSREAAELEDIVLEEKSEILYETKITRKVFRGMIVKNEKMEKPGVRGYIIHQKRVANDEWEDIQTMDLRNLKQGEGIKLLLKTDVMSKLYAVLSDLYKIAEKYGLPGSEEEFVVARATELLKVEKGRREIIKQLLEQNYGDDIWNQLARKDPSLAARLAYSKIQIDREKALSEFENGLKGNPNEDFWQDFFVENEWIFGYGLNYQYLHLITEEADYGNRDIFRSGGERGDMLATTVAKVKFTVLVEIKTPNTRLLKNSEYRNNIWEIGKDLSGGVAQIQGNLQTWEIEGSRTDKNRNKLKNVLTYKPKGLLVIGHTKQLDNLMKKRTFELYRRNIANPEVITFDELYERAKFITKHNKDCDYNNKRGSRDDAIPF